MKKKRNLEIGLWLNTLERSGNVLREQEEKLQLREIRKSKFLNNWKKSAAKLR